MKRRLFFKFTVVLLCATSILSAASKSISAAASPAHQGKSERAAILDSLRVWTKSHLGVKAVFVVKHLKIKEGWAWVHVLPQSPDGKKHYEDISALLRKGDSCWAVVAIPSGECAAADDPERTCAEEDAHFIKTVTTAPLFVPEEIF